MKKSVLKKAGIVVVCMGIFMVSSIINVSAGSILGTSSGMGFSKSWQRYASGDGNRAALTYGFDTYGVNEVYAHAKHSGRSHYAQIRMSNKIYNGAAKNGGSTSSVQKRHTSNSVFYYCIW